MIESSLAAIQLYFLSYSQVFLTDRGTTEEVPLRNIHNLVEDFTKVMDGCIRCRLSNFEGENRWSSQLCDRLKELTECYDNYYITVLVGFFPHSFLKVQAIGDSTYMQLVHEVNDC